MEIVEFLSKVTETYFKNNISVPEAIITTGERLNISKEQIKEWFGRDLCEKREKVDYRRRTVF